MVKILPIRIFLILAIAALAGMWLPTFLSAQSIAYSQYVLQCSFSSFGCTVADYDGDGWDDIFVAGWYGCSLFHNNHDGTFTDFSQSARLGITGRYTVGLWGDLNNDGLPDLFVGGLDSIGPNKVFINRGNGTFDDVSTTSGIKLGVSVGSATFGDFNNDGKVDLFVATSDRTSDILYQNVSQGDSESNAARDNDQPHGDWHEDSRGRWREEPDRDCGWRFELLLANQSDAACRTLHCDTYRYA